jgi:hypothetical protein
MHYNFKLLFIQRIKWNPWRRNRRPTEFLKVRQGYIYCITPLTSLPRTVVTMLEHSSVQKLIWVLGLMVSTAIKCGSQYTSTMNWTFSRFSCSRNTKTFEERMWTLNTTTLHKTSRMSCWPLSWPRDSPKVSNRVYRCSPWKPASLDMYWFLYLSFECYPAMYK